MSASVMLEAADFHPMHARIPEEKPRPSRSRAPWPHRRREWLASPDARQLPLRFAEPGTMVGVTSDHAVSPSVVAGEDVRMPWVEETVRALLVIVVILGGMML